MNKTIYRIASIIMLLALMAGTFSSVQAAAQYPAFHEHLVLGDSASWSFENSGTLESITQTSDGWLCKAGGYTASTHYARVRYKLPEMAGRVLKTFYMKAVIVLPTDFYTKQNASLRLFSTDNFGTTLNGVRVGAANATELRASVYIYSDHKLRVIMDHENVAKKTLYVSSAPLPVGEHAFELYGNLSEVAPWYFKIDGVVIASGIDRLSPDSVPTNERVATRMVVGIDGAADQDQNPMSLLIKSSEIADYDMSASSTQPPTPIPPTSTPLPPTATVVIQPTNTPVQPTATPVIQPTNTAVPATPAGGQTYDDKNSAFAYSSGWSTANTSYAYGGSHRETMTEGATVTFPFNGTSFTIIHKGGVSFSQFDVYVDGTKIGTLNENYSTQAYQLRWDSPVQFPQGNHTLKLVFHATNSTRIRASLDAVIVRSTASSPNIVPTNTPIQPTATTLIQPTDTPVQPTAATVVQPTNTPLQPTATTIILPSATFTPVIPTEANTPVPVTSASKTYDEKDRLFSYSSGWQSKSAGKAYNGSYRETTRDGATVTLPFTGESFTIIYKGDISSSEFDVFVDGQKVGTINQNLSAATYNQRWDYPGELSSGTHTLKLVFHKISSTRKRGSLDAVIVRSTASSPNIVPTNTPIQPTATTVIQPTDTPVEPAATTVIQPTDTPVPATVVGE